MLGFDNTQTMFFDHVLLKNWWENDVEPINDDYKHSILVYNKELDAFVAEESAIALFENGHLTMEGVTLEYV